MYLCITLNVCLLYMYICLILLNFISFRKTCFFLSVEDKSLDLLKSIHDHNMIFIIIIILDLRLALSLSLPMLCTCFSRVSTACKLVMHFVIIFNNFLLRIVNSCILSTISKVDATIYATCIHAYTLYMHVCMCTYICVRICTSTRITSTHTLTHNSTH